MNLLRNEVWSLIIFFCYCLDGDSVTGSGLVRLDVDD